MAAAPVARPNVIVCGNGAALKTTDLTGKEQAVPFRLSLTSRREGPLRRYAIRAQEPVRRTGAVIASTFEGVAAEDHRRILARVLWGGA